MYSVLNSLSEYIYTFTYQKLLLQTHLLLVSKIVKSLQCILRCLKYRGVLRNHSRYQLPVKPPRPLRGNTSLIKIVMCCLMR